MNREIDKISGLNNEIYLGEYLHSGSVYKITLRFLPNFMHLHYCHIEDITRWREDINFVFKWQNSFLRTSAESE